MWNLKTDTLKDQYIHPIDLARILHHCQKSSPAPYVHKTPIAYPTKANKDNWRTAFVGADMLDTYQQFWKAQTTANTRLALFSTWNATWVGDSQWDTRYWHAWAAALVKNPSGKGKHLYIWDCDADMAQDFDGLRPQDFMLGTQVKLIQLAREKGRIDGLWYGGGESAGQDRCVELTGCWIERMATAVDDPFSKQDERFAGFRLISRA
jgi:hypothetical protein